MKFRHLLLRRIGCFPEREFTFADGLNLICGENRTGKSTLVYALFYALFGRHLNPHLRVKDLATKGHMAGEAELRFDRGRSRYRLCQSTQRLPRLFVRNADEGDDDASWETVNLNDPEALGRHLDTPDEVAALTSFFRESELLYFLQDAPKYNKTLLQNLIGMDDALILKARFKRAVTKARDCRNAVRQAAPRAPLDPLSLDLARRQLTEAEQEVARLDQTYQDALAERGADPTVFKLLLRQRSEKLGQRERLIRMRAEGPDPEALAQQMAEMRKRCDTCPSPESDLEAHRREQGALTQKAESVARRITHIDNLAADAPCPLCGQDIPRQRRADLIRRYQRMLGDTETKCREIEAAIRECTRRQAERREMEQACTRIEQEIRETRELHRRIQELDDTIEALEQDLRRFEIGETDLKEAETRYGRQERVAQRRARLQEEVVRHRVAIKQHEDRTRRTEENRKNLAEAERHLLICTVAHQALEDAIQAVGGRLLARVRESINKWSDHFSYLSRFDIQLTERELLPVIQAYGYQYKLNQMSKSERIFLYLLLKLAMGDALGHLGVFVLDDPADGLDQRRKETLAYLLAEVARQRQVVVTTNDPAFADLFAADRRIDLNGT